MVIEPLPPVTLEPVTATDGGAALTRARDARGWIARGLTLAARPGAVDPTPALAAALDQALEAIHEALEAHGPEAPAHAHLHLALDEVRGGIATLHAGTPDARIVAMRHARLADGVLAEALATIDRTGYALPDVDTRAR